MRGSFFADSVILGIEYKKLLFARGFLVVNEVDLRRYAFCLLIFFLLRKISAKNSAEIIEASI